MPQKTSANRHRFLDLTLEENKISGPEYERAGRMEERNAGENDSRRWTRGLAEAALRQDLLCGGVALEYGRLCRRNPGRKREPICRGGGHSTGRVRLFPRREAPRSGECHPWHCHRLLHGGRQHRPDPRRSTPGSRVRLVKPGWESRLFTRGKEPPLCLP